MYEVDSLAIHLIACTGYLMESFMVQLARKALDLGVAWTKVDMKKRMVFLYWQALDPSKSAMSVTSEKNVLAQKNADGIRAMIKSRLLSQDEHALPSTLWWSQTAPPDSTTEFPGRLLNNADQATFTEIVEYAQCWVLSELVE